MTEGTEAKAGLIVVTVCVCLLSVRMLITVFLTSLQMLITYLHNKKAHERSRRMTDKVQIRNAVNRNAS